MSSTSRALVVDTSALIAILGGEPEAAAFEQRLASASVISLSAFSHFEARCVLLRRDASLAQTLDQLLSALAVEVVPFDRQIADVASDAYFRFGKGRHPAALNLGDCASYATAAVLRTPLLFKGDDFALTDVLR